MFASLAYCRSVLDVDTEQYSTIIYEKRIRKPLQESYSNTIRKVMYSFTVYAGVATGAQNGIFTFSLTLAVRTDKAVAKNVFGCRRQG